MSENRVSLSRCKFCEQANHAPEVCPRVREIEYYQNGAIKRVALMRPVDYMQNTRVSEMRFT